MSLISGTCRGGPYDGRRLHHSRPGYAVTYERDRPTKSVPAMVATADPHLARGAYVFHPTSECWHWFADLKTAPTAADAYALWTTKTPPAP